MVPPEVIKSEISAPAAESPTGVNLSRNLLFGVLLVAAIAAFWGPLASLISLSLHDEEYSHLILMPLLPVALLYVKRRAVFQRVHYSVWVGGLVLLAGFSLELMGMIFSRQLSLENRLFLDILSLVIVCLAGFVLCYGVDAFAAGAFPLLLSLLFVPIPSFVMDKPIIFVQYGSAAVTNFLFHLSGVAVFRDGMRFSLPGLDIEVAKQCSGIHSTLALFIFSLVVGYFTLDSGWKKLCLILSIFPIVCFTNGLRIFIISILSIYVDRRFIAGNLHREGGSIFFLLALSIIVILIRLMKRRRNSPAVTTSPA
ncbi:MAG: exosortase/archaeosortase family protein [Terriglobia bacterium]